MVGKSRIIQQISSLIKSSNITINASETERIVCLNAHWHGRDILLQTISGEMLYPSVSIPKVLAGSKIVIYVISSEFYQKNSQIRFFEDLSRQAKLLNVSWEDIPWIFVLNKTDISEENPLLEHIPLSFQEKVIACIATKGQGISEIWDRLTSLLISSDT